MTVWERVLLSNEALESFSTIFISIILEAIPFVMLGALVSSVIHIFVSEHAIARIIPKNRFVGILMASLMGLIFPVCECAIVPVMRRLIKKGVPLGIAVTFMLAVPIVNPIVLTSTYYAFSGKPYMVFLRGTAGMFAAIVIGILISVLEDKNNPIRNGHHEHQSHECGHNHEHHHQGTDCSCGHDHHKDGVNVVKIIDIIEHTSSELYDVGKLLIVGAFLSSTVQTFISRSFILSIGQGPVSSVLVMMGLAYVLSLCSEADAFIARTFLGQFTTGSIVSFLVLGPMIDIKNTLMLSGSFKIGFVARLVALIAGICFLTASLINIFML